MWCSQVYIIVYIIADNAFFAVDWIKQVVHITASWLRIFAVQWLIQNLVKLDKAQDRILLLKDYPERLGLVLSFHNNNIIHTEQILTSSSELPDY